MNKYFFNLLFLVLFSPNAAVCQSQESASDTSRHLFVKVETLLPILTLLTPDEDIVLGASLEYILNDRWSLNLGGYYYSNYLYWKHAGFQIVPEGRYFFHPHQFVGIYLKYDELTSYDPFQHHSHGFYKHLAMGVLYGYRREIRRWCYEGKFGLGYSKPIRVENVFGPIEIEMSKNRSFFDVLLGVQVGYRIF